MTIMFSTAGTGPTAVPASLGDLHDAAGQADASGCLAASTTRSCGSPSPADVEIAKALCQDCPVQASASPEHWRA